MNERVVIDEFNKIIEETKIEIINMEEELSRLNSIDSD